MHASQKPGRKNKANLYNLQATVLRTTSLCGVEQRELWGEVGLFFGVQALSMNLTNKRRRSRERSCRMQITRWKDKILDSDQ
jgi:hypothetical protein